MVYEALTGANPYRARTPDELRERHRHPPRSLADLRPELPRALAAACARALESHPRRRPSAAAFGARAVGGCGRDRAARPSASSARARRRARPARPARCRRSRGRAAPAPRCRACPRSRARRSTSRSASGARASRAAACPTLSERCAARRRASPPAARAARSLIASVLGAFPFWPPGPRAAAGLRRRRCSRWPRPGSPRAFALAVCVPALGDVSAGLAWCVALGGRPLARSPASVRAAARCCPPRRRCWPRCSCGRSTCSPPAACAACSAGRWRAPQGPFAIALWAAVPLAGGLTGSADAGERRPEPARTGPAPRCSCRARPGRSRPPSCRTSSPPRAAACGSASGSQACWRGRPRCPPWRARHPSRPVRSVVAIWAVAILLALGVRAPDGDAPAGKPVSAEE